MTKGRIALAIPLVLVAWAGLTGCRQAADLNIVELTRYDTAAPGPNRMHLVVGEAIFADNPRGQYELLAEAIPARTGRNVRQWLYVKVLWNLETTRVGRDVSSANAQIGYLIQTDAGQPTSSTLYYEGMGNVYVRNPSWLSKRLFEIRHVTLRLTRSDRDRSVDPLGQVLLEGDVAAGADPEAEQAIEPIVKVVSSLPESRFAPPPPPASQPEPEASPEPDPPAAITPPR